MKRLIVVILICLSGNVFATKIDCTQDKNNLQMTCFDPKEVRANGNLRATRLYMGGPNQIDKTPYTLFTDCEIGYFEMRDKSGVVFARDQPTKLHSVQLRDKICDSTPIRDKTLK